MSSQDLGAAIERDDAASVSEQLSRNPELADPSTWNGNPLAIACSNGSWSVAETLARCYPQFLGVKDENGRTPLHIACSRSDLWLIKLLVKTDTESCLTKDNFSVSPLEIVVEHGYVAAIRALVEACPPCIQVVTGSGETMLQLAAKCGKSTALIHLQQLAIQHGAYDLLLGDDEQPDCGLDMAIYNQAIRQLDQQNIIVRELVRLNEVNNSRSEGRLNLEIKNVILAIVSFIGSVAFTAVSNMPSSLLKATGLLEFGAEDVITAQLPSIFYFMLFDSTVFAMCLIAVLALAWSLPFWPVVVFLSVTIGVVYAILVKNIMPKMSVRVGNGSIEGTYLVWFLALVFISALAILYFCFSRGYRVIKRVISKENHEFQDLP